MPWRPVAIVLVSWLVVFSEAFALEITQDMRLESDKVFGSQVIKGSNITIDGLAFE